MKYCKRCELKLQATYSEGNVQFNCSNCKYSEDGSDQDRLVPCDDLQTQATEGIQLRWKTILEYLDKDPTAKTINKTCIHCGAAQMAFASYRNLSAVKCRQCRSVIKL